GKVQYVTLLRAVPGAGVTRLPIPPAPRAPASRAAPSAHHDQKDDLSGRSTPARRCAWRLPVQEGAATMGPAPQEQRSRRARRLRGRMTMAVGSGVVALALVAAGCGNSSTTTGGGQAGTKVKGGTATWALPPSSTPNYIFPFESPAYISVINSNNFAQFMYRPLYWFGNNGQPLLNPSLSLANEPTWSGNTLTLTLKHYMWSNGTPVTATDVMFWMNMLKAMGPTSWGAYTGFPDAFVKSYKMISSTQIQMTTNKAYSHTWFLYNNLSQIPPMPPAWDKTASGPAHCATNVSDCAAVYKYLDSQAKQLTSYASSPLW